MDRIMAASDIMISKVGGITVAESLVIGLPILCINPIPGQEMNNAKFLFDNNIGFRINSASEVQSLITKYLFSKKKLEELNRAMNRLSKPNAAADISKLAIGMIR
jgi:processive 1,2-diacylglycerol beta-glucosyltransferase